MYEPKRKDKLQVDFILQLLCKDYRGTVWWVILASTAQASDGVSKPKNLNEVRRDRPPAQATPGRQKPPETKVRLDVVQVQVPQNLNPQP